MTKTHTEPRRLGVTFAVLAFTAALGACSSMQANPDIDRARTSLGQARSDPEVARNAALELEQAEQALHRAEAAWADKHDTDQTRHLAYLVQQRTAIALNVATLRKNEEQLKGSGAERERLRADSATANAEAARKQAEEAKQQAAQQGDRAAALQRELEQLAAKKTERGMVLTLQDVLFDTGKATLHEGAQRTVERLATVLKEYPERRLLIEGFTDSVGSEESNMELSRKRAESVRQALLDRGVAAERIEIRPNGESYPVASNKTAAGRAQNRRVEILFSDEQGKFAPR